MEFGGGCERVCLLENGSEDKCAGGTLLIKAAVVGGLRCEGRWRAVKVWIWLGRGEVELVRAVRY